MIGLNLRLVAAAAIAVALAASHWKAYTQGEKSVQAAWNVEKLELARQTLRLVDARDRTTQDLQDGAAAHRKAKNERIKALDADLAAALGRLSDRPDRPSPSSVPTDTAPGAGTGSTGAQLYRPDADFLVREAARAQRLVLDLEQCQARYEQARRALN
jgi:hypothetical protein